MDVLKVERPEPPEHLAEIAHAEIEDLEAGRVGQDPDAQARAAGE